MNIIHHHIEITKTTYQKACPYCKKRPIKRKTCGNPKCQYKHHIYQLRQYNVRKTERKRPDLKSHFL